MSQQLLLLLLLYEDDDGDNDRGNDGDDDDDDAIGRTQSRPAIPTVAANVVASTTDATKANAE